jgi:hypothetical protein
MASWYGRLPEDIHASPTPIGQILVWGNTALRWQDGEMSLMLDKRTFPLVSPLRQWLHFELLGVFSASLNLEH